MANSKYEYVKSFEEEDEIPLPNMIVVRVDGRDFRRFSEVHEFEKPNDVKALELMIECAKAVSEQFPDIVFAYGFSDEFRSTRFHFQEDYTVLPETCQQDRLSCCFSLHISLCHEMEDIFPQKDLRYAPSFRSRVINCASLEVIQAYLFWRQHECHLINQHAICLWHLCKCGQSDKDADEVLKGSRKQDRNELLFERFNINYKKDVPDIFRQGTCILKTEVEDIVKYKTDGSPVKRPRRKVISVRAGNIASRKFWNDFYCLSKDLGQFNEDVNKVNPDYVRYFQYKNRLMPSTWIVIRIDGCHFHRFSDIHGYQKPNDAAALNLMNSCAAGILEEFKDIVFAYGVSDEYSFILKKQSLLYERHPGDIVSAVVSLFTSLFILRWKEFFPHKEMEYPPYFDGRAVCYPSSEILRDYLAWRQVDCHINNQYNSCFWMLVKSGRSKNEAQNYLKGTHTQEKNELLDQLSGICNHYSTLPSIFRLGSSVFWDKETSMVGNEGRGEKQQKMVVVRHCNIIDPSFWIQHTDILEESIN